MALTEEEREEAVLALKIIKHFRANVEVFITASAARVLVRERPELGHYVKCTKTGTGIVTEAAKVIPVVQALLNEDEAPKAPEMGDGFQWR